MHDLAARFATKPLFVSDELPHYGSVLGEMFHHEVPYPPTGRPGRPKLPAKIIDKDLDYATVHKTRLQGRVVSVERKIVYGTEQSIEQHLQDSPSQTINTAYVERSNGSWRLWDAHLVRKSLTFARSVRWLAAKFAICVLFYNLVRPHETLSRGADRVFRPTTPGMAAGIAARPWTILELLQHRVLRQ